MQWFFRIMFGMMAGCRIVWLIGKGRNFLLPKQSSAAILRQKKQAVFPVSNGFKRNDRMEYQLVFFLPESRRDLSFTVSPALYETCAEGAGGVLTYQGSRLVNWESSSN